MIHPSDHFVYPEGRFLDSIQCVIRTAERLSDRLVLLGVAPDGLDLDYGWIRPGEQLDWSSSYRIRTVKALVNEPTIAEAYAALAVGALMGYVDIGGQSGGVVAVFPRPDVGL